MLDFFNLGWVGSIIGLLSLTIGAVGIILYIKSRIGPRPACQMSSIRLIGKEEQSLPEDIKIVFQGKEVPRLTITRLWIWNSGKETIYGDRIVEDDPLRCEFESDTQILQMNIVKPTRAVNKFTVTLQPRKQNEALLTFDFLDPNDGAFIEILHTCKKRYPKVTGTIRGIPKGIKSLTTLTPSAYFRVKGRRSIGRKAFMFTGLCMSTFFCFISFIPDSWYRAIDKTFISDKSGLPLLARILFFVFGSLVTYSWINLLISRRRRFPSSLDIDQESWLPSNKISVHPPKAEQSSGEAGGRPDPGGTQEK